MKQKVITLLLTLVSVFCYAQESEFAYVENPLMPHFTYVMQNGLFYRLLEEPSDNNTFGKALLVSYQLLKGHGADIEKPKGNIVIPTAIQNGEGDFVDSYRVVSVDANFDDCNEITSITFPENMRGITFRGFSFKNTKQLKNIKFPSDIPNAHLLPCAFYGSGVEKVILPNGIKTIAYDTFSDSKINKLTIPKSVNKIACNAFRNCINLCDVYLHAQQPPKIDGREPLFAEKVTIHVLAGSINDYKNDPMWNKYNLVGDM